MDKLRIIRMHLSGKSNRTIAKELGVNRKTINKYVLEYKNAQSVLFDQDADLDSTRQATEQITEPPTYKKRKSPPRKWNEEMNDFLDGILASEEKKRKCLHTSKQQLTKKQIHTLMRDEGFEIGYTTVCEKVNEKTPTRKEVFIRQSHPFGKRFEYDFGEVRLLLCGKYTKVFMAVMTAPASGVRFALLYPNQRFDAFIDSQVRFFEHMGGCFEEGVYDNMRNVVAKFVGKSEKLINENLLALAAYYGFKVITTNTCAGNEKGSVENAVKVVRNAAFATHWQFDDLESAQTHLDDVVARLNAGKPLETERAALSEYRMPYEVADIRAGVSVDKCSCVCVDKSHYSVPDCFVGKKVLVKAYPTEIVVMSGKEVVARHARSLEEDAMVLDIAHYLHTLKRKPGALADSTALLAHDKLKEVFDVYYKDSPKEFIATLSAHRSASIDELVEVLVRQRTYQAVKQDNPERLDPIAEQTRNQIKLIGAIGRSVA